MAKFTNSYASLPEHMFKTIVKHMLPGSESWVTKDNLFVDQAGLVYVNPDVRVCPYYPIDLEKEAELFHLCRTEHIWKLHVSERHRFDQGFNIPSNLTSFAKVDEIVVHSRETWPDYCMGQEQQRMRIHLLVERTLTSSREYVCWVRDAWDEHTIDADVDSYEKSIKDVEKQVGRVNFKVVVVAVPSNTFERAFQSDALVEGEYCGTQDED